MTEEAEHGVSSVLGSTADVPDPAHDILVSEANIVEEDAN